MKVVHFDIESNGLLPELTKVHCIAIKDADGLRSFGGRTDEKVRGVLSHLEDADLLIGHNIKKFDIPAIQKVYPAFKPRGKQMDLLLCSRLVWSDLKRNDFDFRRKNPEFPGKLIGSHSLEAWGQRLGFPKDDYAKRMEERGIDPWAEWSEEMESYCRQDVLVQEKLYNLIVSKNYSQEAIDLEHDFADYIYAQEDEGFPFDKQAAIALYSELAKERMEYAKQLQEAFQPWEVRTTFTPKVNNRKMGYVKGVPFVKVKTVEFNPNSGAHVANRLQAVCGWVPEAFTKEGQPKVDEDTIKALAQKYPQAGVLLKYTKVDTIIGMLAEGDNAWLKLERSGRVHGGVITNGAVTGRCAHVKPNLGNIPKKGELGQRCRRLFTAIPGFKLVGCDASGLELRMLAHFMARWDGGAYIKIVLEGDVHSTNQNAAGLPSRENAKTFIYAFLYGAGDGKIGLIIHGTSADGKRIKAKFLRGLPALKMLKDAVAHAVKTRGYIIGLDKRVLPIRSAHSALNTLLQSAGALVVKKATVLLHQELKRRGYWLKDVFPAVHVHDEFQLLVREGLEEEVGKLGVECIKKAGEHFGLRCPLDGEWKAGNNWKETH